MPGDDVLYSTGNSKTPPLCAGTEKAEPRADVLRNYSECIDVLIGTCNEHREGV